MEHTARRVVTGHDGRGQSVIASDSRLEGVEVGPANVIRIWATTSAPADNQFPGDGAGLIDTFASSKGTAVHVVDWAPQQEFPMHRTLTVDYLMVISGALTVELDSGQSTVLEPGDSIVQRGTNHVWRNETDNWCRTVVTLVAAGPVVFGGTPIEGTLT